MLERRNWNISAGKKEHVKVSQQLEKKALQIKKGLSFSFFVAMIVPDELLVVYPFPVDFNYSEETHRLIGSQLIVNTAALLFTRNIKVGDVICYGYLFHIVYH